MRVPPCTSLRPMPRDHLAQAADVLGRAASAQPAGVFVDFRPHDEVAGRLAVTYRKSGPAGCALVGSACQGRPGSDRMPGAAGRENSISGVCIEAIRSVRELAGNLGAAVTVELSMHPGIAAKFRRRGRWDRAAFGCQ